MYDASNDLRANDTNKSNVSNIRCAFRFEQRRNEFAVLLQGLEHTAKHVQLAQTSVVGGNEKGDVGICGFECNIKSLLRLRDEVSAGLVDPF